SICCCKYRKHIRKMQSSSSAGTVAEQISAKMFLKTNIDFLLCSSNLGIVCAIVEPSAQVPALRTAPQRPLRLMPPTESLPPASRCATEPPLPPATPQPESR